MKGFNFEKNLDHQTQAVESAVSVFDNLEVEQAKGVDKQFLNPILNRRSIQGCAKNWFVNSNPLAKPLVKDVTLGQRSS